MNSCNPVFIELGLRLGSEKYYSYFKQFGFAPKDQCGFTGRGGNDHAQSEKYRAGGVGDHILRTVFSDHTGPVSDYRILYYQWRQPRDPSFRGLCHG